MHMTPSIRKKMLKYSRIGGEQVTPMTLEENMRIFNERLIKDQEEKNQITATIL
jgi:hypothetical protein